VSRPATLGAVTEPDGAWIGRARPPQPQPPRGFSDDTLAPPAEPWGTAPWGTAPYGPAPFVGAPYGVPVYAPPVRRRTGRTVLLVVAGVLAACCAGGGTLALIGSGLLQGGRSAPPGLNTPVRDGKFEFVVSRVRCGQSKVGPAPFSRTAQGQFCLVDLSVRNIGQEGQTFADAYQRAYGPDGTKFGADSAAGLLANSGGATLFTLVNPGNEVNDTIVFDIPKGTMLSKVELHDGPLSGGVSVSVA